MTVKETFAHMLKHLREKEGLNQNQLADELGISRGSVSYYENKQRIPDIEVLCKIADYFKVTTEYLLGRSEYHTDENDAIGKKLGLSDGAIQTLENATFDVNIVSELIESEYFVKMIELISDYLVCDDNDTLFDYENFQSSLPSYKNYIISKYIGYILYNIRIYRKCFKTRAINKWKLDPKILETLKQFEAVSKETSEIIKKAFNGMGVK